MAGGHDSGRGRREQWMVAFLNLVRGSKLLVCKAAQTEASVGIPHMEDGLESIDLPYCPACLKSCEVAGTPEHPYWICPSCKIPILHLTSQDPGMGAHDQTLRVAHATSRYDHDATNDRCACRRYPPGHVT